MLEDCPHCYTRVVPMTDGTCPACRKNVRDLAGVDPDRVTMTVAQGDVLPGVCCACGRETSRFVRVISTKGDPGLLGLIVAMLVYCVAVAMSLAFAYKTSRVIEVHLPQCDSCGAGGPPKPRYVDYDNVRMTF